MPLIWENRIEDVFADGIRGYEANIKLALVKLMQSYAPRIEAWMKENASWTDRTGNLRQSLYAEAYALAQGAAVAIDYGLYYGRFLEIRRGASDGAYQSGRYAIIKPAIDHFAPMIWADVQKIMRR